MFPLRVKRDGSTIFSTTERTQGMWSAPKERALAEPTVKILPSVGGRDVFHWGGWLPADFSPDTLIGVPFVRLPKGNWGSRTMTPKELLAAHGFPEDFIGEMVASEFDSWAHLLPIESLSAGLSGVFEGPTSRKLGWFDGGGRAFSSWRHGYCMSPG